MLIFTVFPAYAVLEKRSIVSSKRPPNYNGVTSVSHSSEKANSAALKTPSNFSTPSCAIMKAKFLPVFFWITVIASFSSKSFNQASVHPREIIKRALYHNSAALIVAHNHPSGVPDPSQADRAATTHLKEALALIDVRLLDHIIIGDRNSFSFAESGLL